jgi:hypothetical protein
MSIWTRLFGQTNASNGIDAVVTSDVQPEIPENTFIEKTETKEVEEEVVSSAKNNDNIHLLFNFLSKDFQTQGYDDALVNPDTSYMDQNIETVLSEFDMLIRRCRTFYEDTLFTLDFLIESRSRLGMVDTVDELRMKKEKAKRHMQKVMEMEKEVDEKRGTGERIIVSYKRGFHKGMAAIAHHESSKSEF